MIITGRARPRGIVENVRAELRSKDGVTQCFNFETRSRDAWRCHSPNGSTLTGVESRQLDPSSRNSRQRAKLATRRMEGMDAICSRIELSAWSWFVLGRAVRVLVMRSPSETHGKILCTRTACVPCSYRDLARRAEIPRNVLSLNRSKIPKPLTACSRLPELESISHSVSDALERYEFP
jgi:hypothetical protein